MESYNLAQITKKLYESNLDFFTARSLNNLLEIKKTSTLFSILDKLVKNQIISKLERNKYSLTGKTPHDFTLANFLYAPSYISFESALSFYGILSQFPYEITSATVKKTKSKTINQKFFSYTHLQKNLFWGYEKKDGFLIAFPEKALLDQLYLSAMGYKAINLDEYDYQQIKISKIKEYINKYPHNKQFISMLSVFKKYLKI